MLDLGFPLPLMAPVGPCVCREMDIVSCCWPWAAPIPVPGDRVFQLGWSRPACAVDVWLLRPLLPLGRTSTPSADCRVLGVVVRELGWLFPGEVSPEWADRDLQLDTYSGLIWQVDMMLLLVGGFAHSTSHPLHAFSWQLRRLSSNYFVFSIASS